MSVIAYEPRSENLFLFHLTTLPNKSNDRHRYNQDTFECSQDTHPIPCLNFANWSYVSYQGQVKKSNIAISSYRAKALIFANENSPLIETGGINIFKENTSKVNKQKKSWEKNISHLSAISNLLESFTLEVV